MKINQKLTATVLIVTTIALMFGLHLMIQLETAEATDSSWTCSLKDHRVSSRVPYTATGYTSNYQTVSTTCSACSGSSPSSHQQWQAIRFDMERVHWEHKWKIVGTTWSYCHFHTVVVSTMTYWVTLSCGGSGGGD